MAHSDQPPSASDRESHSCESRLLQVLKAGHFAVTAELNAPDSADPKDVYENVLALGDVCDGINATDGSGANCHMSSVACCALMARAGYEPILQMSCRDRNRIAIQGDLLGAAALGVRNVLCLTGDDVSAGDQPEARRVFDFDALQLLHTAKIMRDQGVFLSGRKLTTPPTFFWARPRTRSCRRRSCAICAWPRRLKRARSLSRRNIVTTCRYSRRSCGGRGTWDCTSGCTCWWGWGPLRSERAAEFMRSRVPGVHIPDAVVDRLAKTPRKGKRAEGIQICVEIIEEVKQIEGVHGVHIMAYRQEETVPEIVKRAGILRDKPKE